MAPEHRSRIDGLLRTLELTDTGARTSADIFTGPSHWMPNGRVFGGQVLAQAIRAASYTVAEGREIHSLHGYFVRPGDAALPITFSVDRTHDGRSFSTRRVQAYQHGLPILSTLCSFQDDDPGLEHQAEMPADLPEPETLQSAHEFLGASDFEAMRRLASEFPFDLRHVPNSIYFTVDDEQVAHQAVWTRALGEMPDDQAIHRAALAYASDIGILEPIFRRHGIALTTPGVKTASLDHAMWWHRPFRVDEWLLFVTESPSASGGRGLSLGHYFTRDGVLVATVAQEGMVRHPRFAPPRS
ncbi:acyl-CoA thioesterase [Ruicaihuangia caeni]|uniref:Acyl-CoA thioesterase 2 n=1 Tax=Ruicaihuangia caeni TaxID=3042517 RepID=A0AAW6T1T6_9MICO|nr:acyl-CoA thioesterase II [Klugiella sp. YN-L-19]MDI2097776.1 acyl-CoA thioesterase II [Klugiella sp. YN-L-19]